MRITKKLSSYLVIITLLLSTTMCSKKDDGDTQVDNTSSTDEDKTENVGELKANTDAPDDSFMVFVDELNLREKPSLDSKTIDVLKRGDKLKYLKGEGKCYENNQGYQWIKVKSWNGTVGWVAQIFTIRERLYSEYKDVVSLVKQGDMKKTEKLVEDRNRDNIVVLDDEGRYLFIFVYSDLVCELTGNPHIKESIYLRSGEGLIGSEFSLCSEPIVVSDDEDYFALSKISPGTRLHEIYIYDINTMSKRKTVKERPFLLRYEFASSSSNLVYLAVEKNKSYDGLMPCICAYEPERKTSAKILEADLSTLEGEYGNETVILKPIPPSEIPGWVDMDKVRKTEIYEKYESGVRCEVPHSEV